MKTEGFFTAFTCAHHMLSSASSIQSIPHILKIHHNFIFHLCQGLPSGFFPTGFPTKTLYTPLLSPIHAKCHAHLILLDIINQIIFGEKYTSSSSIYNFLHSPVTSSLLGPNILNTLFSNTLSLHSYSSPPTSPKKLQNQHSLHMPYIWYCFVAIG